MRWIEIAAATMLTTACGAEVTPPACDADACAAEGKLCEADACVDPWRFGSPVFSRCENEPRATAESLADKAAVYDQRAIALHTHPQMPWVVDVLISDQVDPEHATNTDVVAWWSGENDGLFSGLQLAAEAYRYAATHDPAARDALATLLRGERMRMEITGVPGLFTRQLIPPGVDGLTCPADQASYVPSPEKRGNKWVRIGDDGCAQTSDGTTFQSTTHCSLDRFAGWCFLDNISQDEYAGHVFALGAIVRLVDDAELRADASDLLHQVGQHLVDHDMQFVDWDGRPTQWGKLYPGAPGDTPGYLAILGMSYLATAATATDDPALAKAYRALPWEPYYAQIDQWLGSDGCGANWNNLSMLTAAFHHLLWSDRDPARRAPIAAAFERELAQPAVSRGILDQHNAWYEIMWAAQKPLGPGTDGPAYDAVEDAVCQLRQFPRSNHGVARDTAVLAPEVCLDRNESSLAAVPFDIADRCAATFAYWGNPYERATCTDQPTLIHQPAGYLLPYWMARYYGFISADE